MSRFGSGDGIEAYVDAGDLGAEPEAYAKGDAGKSASGQGKATADSLKKSGISMCKTRKAAVQAGGVPVDSTGVVTNGVRLYLLYRDLRDKADPFVCAQINGTSGNQGLHAE